MASLLEMLDGGDGYLRWKETLLLHLNTVGVAQVLTEDPPPSGGFSFPAAARRWARMDAVCRGHILAALSDRLLPDYARHATARAVWEAVARTYDLAVAAPCVSFRRFQRFRFDDGAPILEQLAHVQALAADFQEPVLRDAVAQVVHERLPEHARLPAGKDDGSIMTMDKVWEEARFKEEGRLARIEDDISEAMVMAPLLELPAAGACLEKLHLAGGSSLIDNGNPFQPFQLALSALLVI